MNRPGPQCQASHPVENHPGTMAVGLGGRMPGAIGTTTAPKRTAVSSSAVWGGDYLDSPSNWRVVTSEGTSASVGELLNLGGAHGSIYISEHWHEKLKDDDDETHVPGVVELAYNAVGAGVGLSIGPIPADISRSTKEMFSDGQIFHGGLSNGEDIRLTDLTGHCHMVVLSGSALGGLALLGGGGLNSVSDTVIYFQSPWYLSYLNRLAMPLADRCKAVGPTAWVRAYRLRQTPSPMAVTIPRAGKKIGGWR